MGWSTRDRQREPRPDLQGRNSEVETLTHYQSERIYVGRARRMEVEVSRKPPDVSGRASPAHAPAGTTIEPSVYLYIFENGKSLPA
jgi:hypothetical protein